MENINIMQKISDTNYNRNPLSKSIFQNEKEKINFENKNT